MNHFTELIVTSNFSFLRGGSHPEECVTRAAELGYRAVGIADRNCLAGVVRGHVAAKKAGVTLLVGARLMLCETIPEREESEYDLSVELLTPEEDESFPFSLLLYPTDRAAYGRLSRLLTLGKSRAPKGRCYLTLEDLAEFQSGLLGIVSIQLLKHKQLRDYLTRLREIFGDDDRLSLALAINYGPDERRRKEQILALSKTLAIPLVATNDVLYHLPERRKLQDVLTCIRKGCRLEEAGFSLTANAERFLKPPQEMVRLFSDLPQAVSRTNEIAEQARGFSLDQLKYEYPHEICPEGQEPQQYLIELTTQGMAERYPQGVPAKVRQLIQHEFALIEELRYAKYFLTVYDIVRFARERGILCQGRGAAANSAVCYCLGITSVDPDKINLLFERFVSRERNEPPDIDIDFEHERREEVIQYIYNRYGRHRAALVAEVISYRSRSAVRDVGKVFGIPLDTISALASLIRHTPPEDLNRYALQRIGLSLSDERVADLIEIVSTLLSFPRHLSQHVGGFIISETPLTEIVPIENAAMADRTVIEWDKDDVESMGMLKVDVLGLGMLTCIRKGLEMINSLHPTNPPLALHSVPPEDPAVYDMICAADTLGVFQIESRAQMSMLPRLRPRCFYDLVIEVAIVRPGPIVGGMVHPYLRRRCGKEAVHYPNEKIREILKTTLGVPIFQEQVMQLVVAAAGFTPGEADNLRRAMANWKRNKDLAGQFGEKIVSGMLANGYARSFAEQVLQQIAGFGEYGFPQSHAASFALLVYVSSWIKHHHPAVFAAALINSQPMGFYQPSQIIQDAARHGVAIREADVNRSGWDCSIESAELALESSVFQKPAMPSLRLGLRLIKGLRHSEADKLAAAVKDNGPYRSLLKLWRASGVRVSSLRYLARADAFRSLGLNRQQALWQIKKFRDEHLPLFDGHEEIEPEAMLPALTKPLEVLHDYEVTGLSLKNHPLHFLRERLAQWGFATVAQLKSDRSQPGMWLSIAGLVLVRQRPSTANGVLFMTLEDETGMANLIIRPKVYAAYRAILCDSTILGAKGRFQKQDGAIHLLVEEATDLSRMFGGVEGMSRDFH